jgi:glycine/D-amino acid oxidase-like deaminating enzyme
MFAVDRLVIAGGVDTPQLLELAGFKMQLRHAPGILAHSMPRPMVTDFVYDGPRGLEFKQMADGSIVGTDAEEAPATPVHAGIRAQPIDFPDEALRAMHGSRILARIGEVMPAARGAELDRVTLGFRPMPIDGFPVVGALPATPDIYVVVTHSGVTLAPILGRYASVELTSGTRVAQLRAYRPDRFAGAGPDHR